MDNPTFDKVRDLSTKFYRELPQALQDELFEALNRGIDILDSEPQMTAYLFAFGKMHQAKLNYAFGKLPEEFFEQPEINIIDYGCGQALGTMCYADFLRENGYEQKVKNITLIEPSEICLKRAALHASVFFPDAIINTVSKTFDELDENDIYCNEDIPTLHILSNVLDILDFDLEEFAVLIDGQVKGYNQFVCVGPYFKDFEKDCQMTNFALHFCNNAYSEVKYKREFYMDKDWTCALSIFSKGQFKKEDNLLHSIYAIPYTDMQFPEAVIDKDGVLYSKDGCRLIKCENMFLRTYSVKEGVSTICSWAFRLSRGLRQIIFPSSLNTIGDRAFMNCSLKQITLPDSVENIGNGAFEDCKYLQQVTILNSVTSIGSSAFSHCESLEEFIIPSSVTTIRINTFLCCKSLKQITIPNSVTHIEMGAFSNCKSLQTITIPDSVSRICKGAFEYCESLRQINIPNSVSRIFEYSFEGCSSLVSIVLPDSIRGIGERAFCGCKSLQEISIPYSISGIGEGAFSGCVSLQEIKLSDSIVILRARTFAHCKSLRQFSIPKSVTQIGYDAFRECISLEQIIIPESVVTIGMYAFYGCKSLHQIAFTKNHYIFIGDGAFNDCESLQQIIVPKGSIEDFKELLDEELWDKLVES